MRLDRAVELTRAEVVLPSSALLVLIFLGAGVASLFNSSRVVHEQHGGAVVELGADGVEEMSEKVAEENFLFGSNIAGRIFSLPQTGGNFEKARAPIDGAVRRHAVRGARCTCGQSARKRRDASVAESVKVRHGDGLVAEHEGHIVRGGEAVQ
eukprot:6209270-Pleurochrysis_carterae.AAC.4